MKAFSERLMFFLAGFLIAVGLLLNLNVAMAQGHAAQSRWRADEAVITPLVIELTECGTRKTLKNVMLSRREKCKQCAVITQLLS
jgi:hypothetical protein